MSMHLDSPDQFKDEVTRQELCNAWRNEGPGQ